MMTHTKLYSHLKGTELFSFFNFSEIKREDQGHIQIIFLKPGGFQEHIDIKFEIMEDIINKAYLLLNRSWIGNIESINPFAKDIIKSFIAELFPDALDQEFKIFLVQCIWNMKGTNDRVICIDEAVYRLESAMGEVKSFLDVVRGIREETKYQVPGFSIKMQNLKDKISNQEKMILCLDWHKK